MLKLKTFVYKNKIPCYLQASFYNQITFIFYEVEKYTVTLKFYYILF